MAMIKCKECKQEVSSSAKTCPHCGVADPALTAGGKLAGCGITVVAFLAICYGIGSWMFSSGDADKQPATAEVIQQPKSLGYTLATYTERLNQLLEKTDRPYRVDASDIEHGEVISVLKSSMGEHAVVLISVATETGQVRDVVLIASGDGTPRSGAEIIIAASTALTAAVPGAELSQSGTWVKEVLEGRPQVVGSVKLSARRTEEMGTWFTAEPL